MIEMMRNMIKAKANPYGIKEIASTFEQGKGVTSIRAVLNNNDQTEVYLGVSGEEFVSTGQARMSSPENHKILMDMNAYAQKMGRDMDIPESARNAYDKAGERITRYISAILVSPDVGNNDQSVMSGPS